MSFLREIEMRYVGQSYELSVQYPNGDVTLEAILQAIGRFHNEHEKAYGHCSPGQHVELVNLRVTAVGKLPKPKQRELRSNGLDITEAVKETRRVFFSENGSFVETLIYDRYRLAAGHRLTGPAVVEEIDSTSVIQPGFQAEVDTFGNLLVTACRKDAP